MERKYEQTLSQISKGIKERNIKLLLPMKSNDGFINKQMSKKIYRKEKNCYITECHKKIDEIISNDYLKSKSITTAAIAKPIITMQLLASHEERIKLFRYKIGILSSEILENPEEKLKNFSTLLNYMEEKAPEIYVIIRKLATISLLEIFKDILPSYNIKLIDKSELKLKKETLRLQIHECSILKCYKEYLQKLETMGNVIRKKQRTLHLKKEDFYLGTLAIICMTNLLINLQYFNFSLNIANFLVPFLDSKYQNIRQLVVTCFIQIFKEDTRGELTQYIIRRLFQYIKKQIQLDYIEITSVLQRLCIKHINHRNDTMNCSKLALQRNFVLYKRQKKYNSEWIEKEKLGIKIEQNNIKVYRVKISLVFQIYFQILKKFGNIQVLSSCLKGLSKFSKYINSHFQQDLVNVLDTLVVKNTLNIREQLHCIHASFIITSYQSITLKTDVIRDFESQQKENKCVEGIGLTSATINRFLVVKKSAITYLLKYVHIGKNHTEMDILIKILVQVLIYRQKNIAQNHLLAFMKRICGMALNMEHNCALGIIYIINQILYNCKGTGILLDTDSNFGNQIYLAETNDPEYCNAYCTSLWEIIALQRHYHVTLKKLSKKILSDGQLGKNTYISIEVLKLSPEDVYMQHDSSKGLFKPTIFIPRMLLTKNFYDYRFIDEFEEKKHHVSITNFLEKNCIDIFKDIKSTINLDHY